MNIHDLRIILGPDNILRRKFCFLDKNTLSMEEYLSKKWIQKTITFDENSQSLQQIIQKYNIRQCIFYSSYKKIKEYPVYLFSQHEVI